MVGINELLRPKEAERLEYDIEALVLSVQIALQRVMEDAGVSRKELAERIGVTQARVSQMLSAKGANLTLGTIGRIAHALNVEFELVTKQEAKSLRLVNEHYSSLRRLARAPRKDPWRDHTANLNRFPELLAA